MKGASKIQNILKPIQGRVNGLEVVYMTYVRKCSELECPLSKFCPYEAFKHTKCKLEWDFLTHRFTNYIDQKNGVGNLLNQEQLDMIGSVLMDLWSQWITLWKTRVGLTAATYRDSKGILKMHPVFKELREVAKSIDTVIDSIGLRALWKKKFGEKKMLPDGSSIDDIMIHGMKGAYEQMAGSFDPVSEKKSEGFVPSFLGEESDEE